MTDQVCSPTGAARPSTSVLPFRRPVTGQFSACQEDVSECVPIPDACSLGLLRSFQIFTPNPGFYIEKANWNMGDLVDLPMNNGGFTHEQWWIYPWTMVDLPMNNGGFTHE